MKKFRTDKVTSAQGKDLGTVTWIPMPNIDYTPKTMKKLSKVLQAIKDKSVKSRTIKEEYTLAKAEKRQPLCIYCEAPLEIRQSNITDTLWEWDKKQKRFTKHDYDAYADKAICVNCEIATWEFVDFDFLPY